MSRLALSQLATLNRDNSNTLRYNDEYDYENFKQQQQQKRTTTTRAFVTYLIPQGHQPSTAKRKAGVLEMDSSMNPLLAAALSKKAKKSATTKKRKLNTTEDVPNGRAVVHSSEPQATYNGTVPRASSSQPTPSTSQLNPPAKKFRAESQPPPPRTPSQPHTSTHSRKPSSSTATATGNPNRHLANLQEDENEAAANHSDADLERDVRAMEDEADRLRRMSRAHSMIDSALLTPRAGSSSPPSLSNNVASTSNNNNARFAFPLPPPSSSKPSSTVANKTVVRGKPRARSSQPQSQSQLQTELAPMEIDTQIPVAENETPQIQRNKRLREGAMAAIADMEEDDDNDNGRGRTGRSAKRSTTPNHRRRSSLSRGKRISTSFEATGVITQPHNTVSESSFYKHIDAELPDVERIRQLLIWCSLRAASSYTKPLSTSTSTTAAANVPSTSTSTSTPTTNTNAPPNLPALSVEASAALKKMQDDFVRMLAEKKIELNPHAQADNSAPPPAPPDGVKLRQNEQNVRNRQWEVTYSSHIQRAQAEDEAWKQVSYEYDAYCKRLQTSLEKRKRAFQALRDAPSISSFFASSSKGKGKGKADGDGDVAMDEHQDQDQNQGEVDREDAEEDEEEEERWLSAYPQPHELPPGFQRGAELARSVLTQSRRRFRRRRRSLSSLPTSTPTSKPTSSTSTTPPTDTEQTLLHALPTLEFKLDMLHTYAHAARATTNICERMLDHRYRALNRALDRRMRSASVPPGGGSSSSGSGKGGGSGKDGKGRGKDKGKGPTEPTKSHVLTTYIRRSPSPTRVLYPTPTSTILPPPPLAARSHSVPPPPPPLPSSSHLPSPHALLRALTRVDAARPLAQVGDAARRAAREVQRVEESGVGAVAGERRVTVLPSMVVGVGVPGTPRRGGSGGGGFGTPGRRERTPGRDGNRERTPGRER